MPNNGDDRFANLLAAYGSDMSRWPSEARANFAEPLSETQQASLRDAQALDQMLQAAANTSDKAPASEVLMSRIMAAAEESDARSAAARANTSDASSDRVVPFHPRRPQDAIRPAHQPQALSGREWTAAAALLAASLVLGIFVGSTESGRTTTAQLGNLAGLSLTTDVVQTTALDDDILQVQDEEDII